jgi:hypothetical protein
MKKLLVCLFLAPLLSFAQDIPKFSNTIFVKGVSWRQVMDTLLNQGYVIDEQNEKDGTITTRPMQYEKTDVREIVYYIRVSDSTAKIKGKYSRLRAIFPRPDILRNSLTTAGPSSPKKSICSRLK